MKGWAQVGIEESAAIGKSDWEPQTRQAVFVLGYCFSIVKMEKKLRDLIWDKNIIIWGARIVGIGFSRKCSKESIDVIGFIDSDESMSGKKINGVEIRHSTQLKKVIRVLQGYIDFLKKDLSLT